MCASQDKFLLEELAEFIGNNERYCFFPENLSRFYKKYYSDINNRNQENATTIIRELALLYNLPINPDFIDVLYDTETSPEHKVDIKRDHVLHTLNVCLLGCYLIYKCEKHICLNFDKSTLTRWLLAAIFHDIGYFHSSVSWPVLKEKIEKLLNEDNSKKMSVIGCLAYFSAKKSDIEELEKYSTDIKKELNCNIKDHGMMSIEILNCIESISEIPCFEKTSYENNKNNKSLNLIKWEEFKQSKEAISYHNRIDSCNTLTIIDLEKNPFISLLHIVDELQDYDRKYLNSEENNYLKIDDVKINFDGEYIIFKFPDKIPEIKSPVKEKLDEYKIRIEIIDRKVPVETPRTRRLKKFREKFGEKFGEN